MSVPVNCVWVLVLVIIGSVGMTMTGPIGDGFVIGAIACLAYLLGNVEGRE